MLDQYVPLTCNDLLAASRFFRDVVVPVMVQEHASEANSQRYKGAWFGIRDRENSSRLRVEGGQMTKDRSLETRANIDGKNDALEERPDINSSWEVHGGDLTKKPYPGAIRTRYDDRFAISGFSWQRDTIGCLWIAIKLERISVVAAAAIAERCGIKPMFTDLYRKLNTANQAAMIV